jgi:RNA polymerase sigma factor (sigma-70 family)
MTEVPAAIPVRGMAAPAARTRVRHVAQAIRTAAPAPSPVDPGAGRAARRSRRESGRLVPLPSDPGRATELLYKHHGGTVLRYAWHLLGRREDAEDATQATFLAVHGALASGTAVLQPAAWVLSIARNECMGRLRQAARGPAIGLLDAESQVPASGGVEHTAELRDEMRTAHHTLGLLPEPEREAFLLREWLGLQTGEVALALGLTPVEVETLAVRARRSLMLAVGGLEPAVGCAGTRAALEAGSLGRAGKVHLLRCPVCRGVRRALKAPDAAARSLLPDAGVAGRLAAVLPGFGLGGGGIVATIAAKTAAAPLLTKTAAVVVAALMTGAVGQEIRSTLPAHHRAHGGQAAVVRTAAPAPVRHAARASAALVTLSRRTTAHASATAVTHGGVAREVRHDGHGTSRGGRGDGGTSSRARGDGGRSGSQSHGDGGRGSDGKSGGDGKASTGESHSGSGNAAGSGRDGGSPSGEGSGDHSGDAKSSGSGDGKQFVATVVPAVATGSGGSADSSGSGDSGGSGDASAAATLDHSGSGGSDGSGGTTASTSGGD